MSSPPSRSIRRLECTAYAATLRCLRCQVWAWLARISRERVYRKMLNCGDYPDNDDLVSILRGAGGGVRIDEVGIATETGPLWRIR